MGKEIAAFDYEGEREKFEWNIPEDYNFVEKVSESCLIMGLWDSLFSPSVVTYGLYANRKSYRYF